MNKNKNMAKSKIVVKNAIDKSKHTSDFLFVDKKGNIREMTPNRKGRKKAKK
jgi:hypothetical protein